MKRPALALAVLVLVAAVSASGAARAGDGDVDAGRRIAETHCSRCHVVGDFNRYGGIDSTPSFKVLKSMDDWRERFRTFYARNPHPAFVRIEGVPPPTKQQPYAAPVELPLSAVDDILAFAATIKTQ